MSVRSRLSSFRSGLSFDFTIHDLEAIIVGGLFGGLQIGFIMGLYRTEMTYKIGSIVGMYSLQGGWTVTVLLGVLFAIPFVAFVSGSINSFANTVIMLSSRSSILQKMLVPLLKRSALGITCGGIGLLYGIVVAIIFHVIAMPIWLQLVTGISVHLSVGWVLTGIVAYALYGGALGLIYGLILENSTG